MRTQRVLTLALAGVLLAGLLPLTAAAQPVARSGDRPQQVGWAGGWAKSLPSNKSRVSDRAPSDARWARVSDRAPAPLEPALRQALELEGRANYFVVMAVAADLSPAYTLDWQARGAWVWRALNEVARTSQAPVIAYAQRHGLDYRSFLTINAVFVRGGTPAAAQELAALPGVAELRLEQIQPLDPLPAAPEAQTVWGIIDVHAPEVWALGVRGAGAVVANIDTGVQWNHPALVENFKCVDPSDPRCWYDPAHICGGSACDNNGHGTATMGVAVAKDDPTLPYIAGVAPDAQWIACKGCETNGCSDFSLTACADWMLAPGGDPANRPNAVNNSWGGGGGDPWFRSYVQAWVAAGIFPAAAAGGSGPGCATLGSPCDYPEMLCTTGHDQSRAIASFSSRGPGSFGDETKPNISAPGVNLQVPVPTDSWATYSGSSFASPHSVGAIALVYSACPQLIGDVYGSFAVLQDNADPPPPGDCGAPPDGQGNYTYGYGYLNVQNAVQACTAALHVGNIVIRAKVSGAQYVLGGTVPIRDQANHLRPGAAVSAQWTLPNGRTVNQQAVTNATGLAKFALKRAQTGTYRLCVTGVTAAGYAYDPSRNVETCEALTIP